MTEPSRQYIPGVCNLGQAETRRRFLVGVVGILLSVALAWGLIVGGAPRLIRLVVFLPAFVGTLGFLQAFLRFCVAYGVLGIFNVSVSLGRQDTVKQAEFRRKDRQTACKIITLSAVLATAVTTVVYVFPE